MGKGIRKGIKQPTHTRADKKPGRVVHGFKWTYGGIRAYTEEAAYFHHARRFFTVYVGKFYTPIVAQRQDVRAAPRGFSDDVFFKVVFVPFDGGGEFREGGLET